MAPIAEDLDARNWKARPLVGNETEVPAWFGAAVYLRGRLIGYAPVRCLTWAEHLATLADLEPLCGLRHFRFSGSAWEVVTKPKEDR